ncbi:MAG: hypothetical protein BIFFINMI_00881 [Phycisphaerae bacterium]|nr:hypothetical protein [Phycisphaerae bacterium]
MRTLIIIAIALLVVLHQDFWWWDRAQPLLWGVLPIGLAWHAGLSLAAAALWLAAVKWCWPAHLEVEDDPAAPPPTPREDAP